MVSSINKSLVPLIKEDSNFSEVAPNLFGPEFSKRAKDFVDEVKTLRLSFVAKKNLQFHKIYFPRGQPSDRGMARTRGRDPNQYRGGQSKAIATSLASPALARPIIYHSN